MRTTTASENEHVVVWQWRRNRRCVGLARAQLRKALGAWGLGAVEFAAVAVLSELVANAVVHARVPAGREIRTRFLAVEGGVRIEVHDACDAWPLPRVPDESGGYGLLLVAELADGWGVEKRRGVGKCVWAVVTSSGAGGR
ncbi:ATP-binding protein [Streptomyces sp. 184]|uniref:ATP-binding protein n=1 Tax=Streptomyces sp. 184 TaxID=1827526 RepID=UPI003891C949